VNGRDPEDDAADAWAPAGDQGAQDGVPARAGDQGLRDDAAAQGERAYDLFQTGRRFLAERHPAQAAMFLERALLLAPDKNSIREALGRSYYALGSYGRATHEFEELLRRAPANDYAHYALARCLLRLGAKGPAVKAPPAEDSRL